LKFKHIIWDYNGTILDDVDLCLDILNHMLYEQGNAKKSFDLMAYKEIFGFPIIDYYIKAGFDFEKSSFAELADSFIDTYYARATEHRIKDGMHEILKYVSLSDSTQSILTASMKERTQSQLNTFEISGYFSHISGLNNNQAKGKDDLIPEHLSKIDAHVNEILFVGDTDHDLLVANKIGCKCVLVSDGHQSSERLMSVHADVVNGCNELLEYIK